MSKTFLITGANGRIGTALVKHIDSHNSDYHLILADLAASEERGLILDVRDLAAVRSVFEEHDIDTVIYLAGLAFPYKPFEHLLPSNIDLVLQKHSSNYHVKNFYFV